MPNLRESDYSLGLLSILKPAQYSNGVESAKPILFLSLYGRFPARNFELYIC